VSFLAVEEQCEDGKEGRGLDKEIESGNGKYIWFLKYNCY